MKKISVFIFAFLLSGCSILGYIFPDEKGIPENRVMQKDLLKAHEGLAEIQFVREDTTVSGTRESANLFLNNKPLAALWADEKFSIWVKPGLYIVSLNGSERRVSNEIAFGYPNAAPWKVEVDARVDRRGEVRVDFTNWTGDRLQSRSTPVLP